MMAEAMEVLEGGLRKGNVMHAFLSGGGLRVVRMEKSGRLVGYGEHPSINEALKHLAEDFEAGGREYEEVYGKLYPHYLTGQTKTDGELDAWIRHGRTFDCRVEGDEFVVELIGMEETRTPDGIIKRAEAGEIVEWEARGYTFKSYPSRLGNSIGAATEVLKSPKGARSGRAWMYYVKKTGRSSKLQDAFELALKAPSVEIPDPR